MSSSNTRRDRERRGGERDRRKRYSPERRDRRHSTDDRRERYSPDRRGESRKRSRDNRKEHRDHRERKSDEKRTRSNEGSSTDKKSSTNSTTTLTNVEAPIKSKVVEPISIEELLKTQKEKADAESKPKFMTRAERERLALERRAAEVASMEQKRKEIEKSRNQFLEKVKDDGRRRSRDDRRGRDSYYRDRSRDRDRDRRRDRDRNRGDSRSSSSSSSSSSSRGGKKRDSGNNVMDERIKEEIRNHYLGIEKVKKKVMKPSDKFKFVFEWDASEDTSRDHNPLYANKANATLAFGRGFIAGIDQREQLNEMKKHRRVAPKLEKSLESYLGKGDTGLHWSEKPPDKMTGRDWRIFKEDFNIATRGGSIPHPVRSWKESGLPPMLLKAVDKAGYKEPSPIQRQAIPIGLQNRDILGVAETGSGKTAAFVLPMLVYISNLPPLTAETEADGPLALIMAPTRELVQQIEQETRKFASEMGMRTVALVGGQPIEEQAFHLRRGCEIVMATPGRLNDCLERRYIVLNQCNYVVMDEADRMIDMGFEPQVNSILDAMPASSLKSENEKEAEKQEKSTIIYRVTMMYSATMPPGVERLSRKYLRRPAHITIGVAGRTADKIEQRVEWVKGDADKKRRLVDLLYTGISPPIMVFANTKKSCDAIARSLEKLGFKCAVLHSGRSQDQREYSLAGFKSGKHDILVATDVAGRGIDVKGVTHVINYDMPKGIEAYTHRIGRTGRAGRKGIAISYIMAEDEDIMYDIKDMLVKTNSVVPPELAQHPASKQPKGAPAKRRRDTVIHAK